MLYNKTYAQVKSNLVTKTIAVANDTVQLDVLSIVPNTIQIKNVDSSFYKLDAINAILVWLKKPTETNVVIQYRTFPFKLNRTLQLYNYDSVKNNFLVKPFLPKLYQNNNKLIDLGKIEYTGSFGRGISFGNAQDAVLNSNLNLQLTGMLADSIEIAASLSDQNLPIQPDGSTAQLNEIDRIFIQLKKKNWVINAGDIDLRQDKQYYLNFYKRLQGLSFETTNKINKNWNSNLIATGAIAKGKFTNNTFQGLEGNQGPYRLKGANNEFFFIVLSGTERVFMDGELLKRGEDQDYIINYNTAEITFTPQRLITKDKRIRVEFEYSDRNYVNSQLYASNLLEYKNKLKIRLSAYSNVDAKNSPINQELNTLQKTFLANIGDSIQNAYYPTVEIDTLGPGKILYKRIDSIYNGILFNVFIYSTAPDSAKFNLSFAELGQGKGNYKLLQNGANGKVFKWYAPVGGIKQGNYEPVQYLVTPRKQQIYSLSTSYNINNNNIIDGEFAISNNDINTLAIKEKGNDKGFGAKIKWNNIKKINKTNNLNSNFAYEYNNTNFRTIERLRTPEFNRDWNLPLTTNYYNEQLTATTFDIQSNKSNSFKLQLNNYRKSNGYNGYRQSISTQHLLNGWNIQSNTSYTNTIDSFQKGLFIRPTLNINKSLANLKNIKVGFNFFLERNELLNKIADTLTPFSIAFDSYKMYLQSNEKKQDKWGLSYTLRNNRIPILKQLLISDKAQDIEASTSLTSNPKHQFNVKATYRKLDVSLPQKVNYKSDQTLLGRAEYSINEWKGLLQGALLYETGSGQEQRREFAYLQVPNGQGEFYWIDYNSDGIQQLNEFELAQFRDQRQFIKIFVPTNQFIKANFNNFNYSFAVNPKSILNKQKYKGFKKIWSKMYLQSALQIQKKEQSNNLINGNPFKTNLLDTSLISLNRTFSNTFSFNKYSTKWGIDFNQDYRINKALLTYGYESRDVNSYSIKTRWNVKNKLLTEVVVKKVNNILLTPAFNNRNYNITQQLAELRFSYTYKTLLRVQTIYSIEKKQNSILFGGEKTNHNNISLEAKYNALQNAAINGKFTVTNISFNGTPNSTVGFIMLDALVPGKNYLWNIDLIKTLKNNLEITFRYEGRKTGVAQTIHIGSATMRANFY